MERSQTYHSSKFAIFCHCDIYIIRLRLITILVMVPTRECFIIIIGPHPSHKIQRANRRWQMHGGSKGRDFPIVSNMVFISPR
jgi:hypothetical protein